MPKGNPCLLHFFPLPAGSRSPEISFLISGEKLGINRVHPCVRPSGPVPKMFISFCIRFFPGTRGQYSPQEIEFRFLEKLKGSNRVHPCNPCQKIPLAFVFVSFPSPADSRSPEITCLTSGEKLSTNRIHPCVRPSRTRAKKLFPGFPMSYQL